MKKRIFITGGTFGHIYPALMFAKIKKADLFIESKAKKFIPNEEINLFSFEKTLNPLKIIKSLWFFYKKIRNYDEIYIFGGYSCLPVILASIFTCKKKILP